MLLSTPSTSWPCAAKYVTTSLPTNPPEPVTSSFMVLFHQDVRGIAWRAIPSRAMPRNRALNDASRIHVARPHRTARVLSRDAQGQNIVLLTSGPRCPFRPIGGADL